MDDEKPDIEEDFWRESKIGFVTKFHVEEGVIDEITFEKAQKEIAEHIKNQFEKLNPFENPETLVAVEFPAWSKTHVVVVNEFRGMGEEFVQWSSRKTKKLEKNLVQATANLLTPESESCATVGEVGTNILSKMTPTQPFPSIASPLVKLEPSFKLHRWMADLSPKMRKVPFTMLAIPGTHNSATHTMQSDQLMSYDSPLYADLSFMTPETLASWGRCVKHDINQQLEMGIRYFDFRFKTTIYLLFQLILRPMQHRKFTSEVWNAHNLYATKLSDELNIIKNFLTKYSTEVVILHMNHGWQGMNEIHFEQLNKDVNQM